jgi:catechol 2,3-dioxygenase-like lactoylglutathione lyase family enzyme
MIKCLGTVPVFVSDSEQALAFYRDKLGFKVVADHQLNEEFRWLTVVAPDAQTELCLYCPISFTEDSEDLKKRIGTWTGMVFLTDNLHETFQEMREKGVEFETPQPIEQPWGLEIWFRDPDGNRFNLVERKS